MRKKWKAGRLPTLKQRMFAQKWVENRGNGTQAALQVYDADYDNASAIAHENIRKPAVLNEIKKCMTRAGLTLESLSEYGKQALVAGLGEKATNSDAIRMLETFFKLWGVYPDKRSLKLNYSFKETNKNQDIPDLVKQLNILQEKTSKLLQDLTRSKPS